MKDVDKQQLKTIIEREIKADTGFNLYAFVEKL